MLAATQPQDAVDALNARARARGWTFTADRRLEFHAPKLTDVCALWHRKACAGRIPRRADFSARELKGVLADLMIMDIVWSGQVMRLFHRYTGSAIGYTLGENTGKFMDDTLPPPTYERTVACFETVARASTPLRFTTRFSLDRISFLTAEFFAAPLAEDGVTPDKLMAVAHVNRAR